MTGWIKLHRVISNHWIYQNSQYFHWWVDILMEVNHTPSKSVIGSRVIECGIGEKLYSLDTWAQRWKTNKSKVKRFFDLLQSQGMIEVKSETKTTRIKVCNYEGYQCFDSVSETQMIQNRNGSETQLKPIKELKNDNNIKLLSLSEPEEFDPLHFYIAKSFHNLFIEARGLTKTLKDVNANSYIKTIRLLMEKDGATVEQLTAIRLYFEDGSKKLKGVNSFWIENTYSVSNFRESGDDGVYRWDRIAQEVKKWLQIDGNHKRVTEAVEMLNEKVEQWKMQEVHI